MSWIKTQSSISKHSCSFAWREGNSGSQYTPWRHVVCHVLCGWHVSTLLTAPGLAGEKCSGVVKSHRISSERAHPIASSAGPLHGPQRGSGTCSWGLACLLRGLLPEPGSSLCPSTPRLCWSFPPSCRPKAGAGCRLCESARFKRHRGDRAAG